jgi:hypothetical protein
MTKKKAPKQPTKKVAKKLKPATKTTTAEKIARQFQGDGQPRQKSRKVKKEQTPRGSGNDAAERIKAGISGGGVSVYWETDEEEGERCCAEVHDEDVNGEDVNFEVLLLLLDVTERPEIRTQNPELIRRVFGDDGFLRVNVDKRPSRKEFEQIHDRLLALRQLVLEPTKDQAVDLAGHREQAVRDYAISRMAEWHKRWKNEKQQSKRPAPERRYYRV